MAIAIIGGTGVYQLGGARDTELVPTPYGEAAIVRTKLGGREAIFLARHGAGHALPPHRINYRANIWALHTLGVREVLATQAVGSLNMRYAPGHFVLLSNFLDFTKARPSTFFDGENGEVVHVDVTEPYCPRMTAGLQRAGAFLGNSLHTGGLYACMEGPRFETAAEIRMLRMFGANVVGMTNVPEVVLAREAGLCYAAVCIVCNWAAGMTSSPLTQEEVLAIMQEQSSNLHRLVEEYLYQREEGSCPCAGVGFGQLLPR